MALLLNIDTATEVASVCISEGESSLAYIENRQQREHASFVHAAVHDLLQQSGLQLKDMEAFSVTSGPGSYTGLRVGMAAAKGFCYAFGKSFITINTLEVMAKAALSTLDIENDTLLCPMIDARRMEVFTAVYDVNLNSILSPRPVVLEDSVFKDYLEERKTVFFGSGSKKLPGITLGKSAVVKSVEHNAKHLAMLAAAAIKLKKFSDVSYSEPKYLKDFFSLSN